jgi:DNA-directed RNA polymerase subunit RPC12/RpoP
MDHSKHYVYEPVGTCIHCDHERETMVPVQPPSPEAQLDSATQEILKLKQWISDLQSNMYVNCVYCGYRAGEQGKVPAQALMDHIAQCPKHPLTAMKKRAESTEPDALRWRTLRCLSHHIVLKIIQSDHSEWEQQIDVWTDLLRTKEKP